MKRCMLVGLSIVAFCFAFVCGASAAEIIIPGDMISVVVAGEPAFSRTVVADSAGTVALGKAVSVEVAGLSLTDAAAKVASALGEYVKSAQVTVTILSAVPRTAGISGQVAKPQTYAVMSQTTLSDLIQMAGGPTEGADLARIVITRRFPAAGVISVNLEAFRQNADPTGNPPILPNDAVLIPAKPTEGGSVYVTGEAALKGPVPYREGMTIRDVLAAAGGPTKVADTARVTLKRQGEPDRALDYAAVTAGDPNANLTLHLGDSVFLPALELTGGYTVRGEVNRRGEYILRGVTKLTDALEAAGGLKKKAASDRIKIIRYVEGKKSAVEYNLEEISAERSANPVIQPGDVVSVPREGHSIGTTKLAGVLIGLYFLLIP